MRTIIKTVLQNAFAQIPNATLRDKRLSFKARGILAMILSNREEWSVSAGWLSEQGTDGRDAVRSGLKELIDFGYAKKLEKPQKDSEGKWAGSVWVFYDIPQECGSSVPVFAEKPSAENPPTGKPLTGNPLPQKNKEQNTNKEEDNEAQIASPSKPTEAVAQKPLNQAPKASNIVPPKPAEKPKRVSLPLPPIPASLNTPEFCAAWNDWIEDRKARKHPITPLAAKRQFIDLEKIGPESAVRCIDKSITNGWQGLYTQKEEARPAQQPARRLPNFNTGTANENANPLTGPGSLDAMAAAQQARYTEELLARQAAKMQR